MTRFGCVVLALGLLAGCSPGGDPSDPRPAEAEFLPRPFSADEIRDEMIIGLTLELGSVTPTERSIERWTVVSADAEGVEIEYTDLDEQGQVLDKPRIQRAAWVELRDHATFPTANSRREEVTLSTPLGNLPGWLYLVTDEAAGSVTEFFFARDLPGAPVLVRTTLGDTVVMQMTQLRRHRP